MGDQPLGPILHVVNHEAIVKPHKKFEAHGATVITTDNKVIGKLDYPIGRVDNPYQVIRLSKKVSTDLVGKFVIAKMSDRRGSKYSKSKKKKFGKKRSN